MKTDLIIEIAFLYLSNPRYWTRDRICKQYGIKPTTLDKIMLSPHWQRVIRIVKLNEQVASESADQFLKEDHTKRLEKYYDNRYDLGGIQSALTLRVGKLLMRAVMELESVADGNLLDTMKEYSGSIGNYAKAFCLFDDQSMKNSNLALAVEEILERIEIEDNPKQLTLFGDEQ